MNYRKILITGGAGFVGSNLARFLSKDFPDAELIVLDNLKRRGSELNLPGFKDLNIKFVHGDIRNPEDFEAVGPIDLLLECSAEPSVLASSTGSIDYVINTNLVGTINCLSYAAKMKADFVFFSTSRVYPVATISGLNYDEEKTRFEISKDNKVPGVSSKGFSEHFPLEGSRSLYGATKLSSELFVQEFIEMSGIRAIINRCGVLTGPWQMGKVDQGVIVLWIARHIYQKNLSYIGYGGTGKQVRDILHIRDLYELLLIQLADPDKYSGKVFNVGGGREVSVSLQELTDRCEFYTGNKIEISSVLEEREMDIPLYLTDNTKISNLSGWKPKRSVDNIIEETTRWVLENKESLSSILN